jgi:hypothetical protein
MNTLRNAKNPCPQFPEKECLMGNITTAFFSVWGIAMDTEDTGRYMTLSTFVSKFYFIATGVSPYN